MTLPSSKRRVVSRARSTRTASPAPAIESVTDIEVRPSPWEIRALLSMGTAVSSSRLCSGLLKAPRGLCWRTPLHPPCSCDALHRGLVRKRQFPIPIWQGRDRR